MNENELAEFRRGHIGFIFQSYELIPHLTVRENVEMPLMFQKVPARERKERALALLDRVGLAGKSEFSRPSCPVVSSNAQALQGPL